MAPSRTAVAAGLVAAAAAAYAAFRASAKRRGAAEAEEAAGVGAGAGSEAKDDVAGASTIRVNVLFFASAREMAGCDRYVAELPVGARTSTLRAHLKDKFLLLGEGALDTPMAINEAYVPYDEDPELSDLDDVALIPPISGG